MWQKLFPLFVAYILDQGQTYKHTHKPKIVMPATWASTVNRMEVNEIMYVDVKW